MKKIFSCCVTLLFIQLAQAQNVGIGTSTPTSKLEVRNGALTISNTLTSATLVINKANSVPGASNQIIFQNNGDEKWALGGANIGSAGINDFSIYNYNYGLNALTILSSNNVGIGTVTPRTALEVAGQITITGGSPGEGKVLTSDASGLASWKSQSCNLSLGQVYLGGYIFYLDPSGCHGLVADFTDLGILKWSLTNNTTKAYADWVLGGIGNTKRIVAIINGLGNSPAADACYLSTRQGYSDWYLPSKIELEMMYVNLHLNGIGGFSTNTSNNSHVYWSSTEGYGGAVAWYVVFVNGSPVSGSQSLACSVRAVRSF